MPPPHRQRPWSRPLLTGLALVLFVLAYQWGNQYQRRAADAPDVPVPDAGLAHPAHPAPPQPETRMSESRPTWSDRLFVAVQHPLPQHALSGLMYRLARVEWPPLKDLLIDTLVQRYAIDMSEALEPNPRAYPHFNALFTRALRPDARPIDPDPRAIVAPVDGVISQLGRIEQDRLIQAKGHAYGVAELLGLAPGAAHPYADGQFMTIYLSPRDYHRIHMPLAGTLTGMTYLPGRLLSVNAVTAALVPELFARNERLVCRFDTAAGDLALVMVGAIFVGGMETVWAGEVTPARLARANAPTSGVRLERGAELGRFNLGSTVILLLPPGSAWDAALAPGQRVRLGQRLGAPAP